MNKLIFLSRLMLVFILFWLVPVYTILGRITIAHIAEGSIINYRFRDIMEIFFVTCIVANMWVSPFFWAREVFGQVSISSKFKYFMLFSWISEMIILIPLLNPRNTIKFSIFLSNFFN